MYWEGTLPRVITPLLKGGTFRFGDGHFVFEMLMLIFIFYLFTVIPGGYEKDIHQEGTHLVTVE